jgi:hypothetical protein
MRATLDVYSASFLNVCVSLAMSCIISTRGSSHRPKKKTQETSNLDTPNGVHVAESLEVALKVTPFSPFGMIIGIQSLVRRLNGSLKKGNLTVETTIESALRSVVDAPFLCTQHSHMCIF